MEERWAESAAAFEDYVRLDPLSAAAWANLSFAYKGLGETAKQLEAAGRAMACDPEMPGARLVLGESLIFSGRFSEALDVAKEGLARDSRNRWMLEIAARSCQGLHQPGKAIDYGRKAIRETADFNIMMHDVVADCLSMIGRYNEAIREFDLIIGNKRPTPTVLGADLLDRALVGKTIVALSKSFRAKGDEALKDVLEAAEAAIQYGTRDPRPLVAAGIAHRRLAHFEISLDYLDRAIHASDRHTFLALARGLSLYELGRFSEAIDELTFAATETNDTATRDQALTYMPLAHLGSGRDDDAFGACEAAINVGIDNSIVRNILGTILISRGDLDLAREEFERACELAPGDPVPLTNRGWIALQDGDYVMADQLIDRALQMVEASGRWPAWKTWVTKYLSLVMQDRTEELSLHVERMRQSLGAYPSILQRAMSEIERVSLESELALASSLIRELQETPSQLVASTGIVNLDAFRQRLEAFEQLLNKEGVREEEVKQFLKSQASRFMFGLECIQTLTEHELGSDFVCDFVLQFPPNRYTFVELENPRRKLYTKQGNPAQYLNHGRQQVEDWQEWAEEHGTYLRSKLPDCRSPEGLIIIGRRASLDTDGLKRLDRSNINTRGQLRILTFDDLLDAGRTIVANLEASASLSQP